MRKSRTVDIAATGLRTLRTKERNEREILKVGRDTRPVKH